MVVFDEEERKGGRGGGWMSFYAKMTGAGT